MAKVRCQRQEPSPFWYLQNCHPLFSLTHWAIIIPQWLFGCWIPPPVLGLALAGYSWVHPQMAFSPPPPQLTHYFLFFFFLSFSTSSQCLQQTHRLVFFSGFQSSNCVANTKLGFQILSDQDLRFPKAWYPESPVLPTASLVTIITTLVFVSLNLSPACPTVPSHFPHGDCY